ncbi:MAG: AzlD domain-containing protein [Chloroflexota bacterium]|nr:AzlD domain-containing protein [Chloroflexota bacterium]
MTDLVPLALLMALATYPSRALPLLLVRSARFPALLLAYLRLVGPAVLAALAAVNTVVVVETAADGRRIPSLHVGIEWMAVVACLAVVVWRKNLFLGIAAAVAIVAVARTTALA